MTELSPAAQAVLDAYRRNWLDNPMDTDVECLAAALRAAALHLHSEEYETCGGCSYALMIDVDDLLAIAAELDPTTTPSESDFNA